MLFTYIVAPELRHRVALYRLS